MNSLEKYEEIIAEYGSMEAYQEAMRALRSEYESERIESSNPPQPDQVNDSAGR